MVNLGEGVHSAAKRITNTIVIRMNNDLYVEFKRDEARKTLKDLICLYSQKISVAEKEITKITVSMREV